MWFIGVEVEQEMSAPLPKKILDPPLLRQLQKVFAISLRKSVQNIVIIRDYLPRNVSLKLKK